jgi:hypothetical protein
LFRLGALHSDMQPKSTDTVQSHHACHRAACQLTVDLCFSYLLRLHASTTACKPDSTKKVSALFCCLASPSLRGLACRTTLITLPTLLHVNALEGALS